MAESTPAQSSEAISLSRWSRLKRAAAEEQAASAAVRSAPADELIAVSESGERAMQQATSDAPASTAEHAELPPISSISLAEDFTPFMQAKVPQALKQQALKALFREPHFNVMDGLDIYIDDYTVFEPISPEVMATLSSWKTIMNPPQQVVTADGYAVDVESDEGKAVLAARTEAAQANASLSAPAQDLPLPGNALPDSGEAESAGEADSLPPTRGAESTGQSPPPDEIAAARATPHPRHGKRVSDFSASTCAAMPSEHGVADSEHADDTSAATKSTAQ